MFSKVNKGSCNMLHMASVSLGEYVRSERERRKWTLRQLAEYSGVSFSMIAKIETGSVRDYSLETVDKIAKGLNVPVLQLVSIALGLDATSFEKGLSPEESKLLEDQTGKMSPEQLLMLKQFAEFLQWRAGRS